MAFIYVLVYIFVLFNGLFAEVLNVTPVILEKTKDQDEVIIDAESDYNLTCQGTGSLKWTFPKMDYNKTGTSFTTTDIPISNNDLYTNKLILHIKNITYPFVGYYICTQHSDGIDMSDEMYVYVNDPAHLSVEDTFKVYYAVQYEEAVIPCRPTSPDIQVELIDSNDKNKKGKDRHLDPRRGIIRKGFSTVSNHLSTSCNFSRGNVWKKIDAPFIVEAPRSSLAKPYIEDTSNNHTEVGGTLSLKCYLQDEATNIGFELISPRGPLQGTKKNINPNVYINNTRSEENNGKKYLVKTVTINNVTKEDSGNYTCRVYDRQNHTNFNSANIHVQDKNSCFIHISVTESDQKTLHTEEGEFVQWVLNIAAHPDPVLEWYDSKDKEIKNSSNTQYTIEKLPENRILFKINNTSLENNGTYTVRGRCSQEQSNKPHSKTELRLSLLVLAQPKVILKSHDVYLENTSVQISCTAVSNPLSKITWNYKEYINETGRYQDIPIKAMPEKSYTTGFSRTSYIALTPKHKGVLTCFADNSFGSPKEKSVDIYISDVNNGFDMYNFDDDITIKKKGNFASAFIAKNYPLKFTCAVSPHKAEHLQIFHNNTEINDAAIEVNTNNMSMKTTFIISQANINDSGLYSCRIQNRNNKYEFKNLTVFVQDPEPPKIFATNLQEVINIKYPAMPTKLYCNYTGVPKVSVEWYKDNKIITENGRIFFEEGKSILKFESTVVTDEGSYKCRTYNDFGESSKVAKLTFQVKPISLAVYYAIIAFVMLLLIVAIIYIVIKIRKDKALKKELKRLGLENFHKGNPEHINPEIGIDDQAELLPYDKKWEFPIEKLKLGKQLGSGAFGVVMKADARGIIEGEEKTIVAVKMVKKNADHTYIKALASELKIMAHLGKHINVVNLLGACTENVAKKELLVIVEFCRFGNLQNYLFKHRESFINQVDPRTGTIDCNIGSQVLDRLYSVSSDNESTITPPYSMQDYREKERNVLATTPTQVTSAGENHVTLSNNSIQPEWRTNYRGDYRGDVKPVSTTDLITWSFQIARGMEYLASRKVLHGDLAARNILLADKNVVKICDFGLAKSMYNDNNYKKKGNSPLPIKWMAIESIRDRVFSTQSDVWSFGIVLWELFSLAHTPYPGMEADERLYHKLIEGYRMESPVYAPKIIYDIMEDCWQSKPLARPSFTSLVERIGNLLENSVKKHYIELNDPYLMMNTQKIEGEDYLAMVSPPSFDLLSAPSPHYVNEGVNTVIPASRSPEGYTFMGANTIFSPRLQESGVFDFNIANRTDGNTAKEYPELYPMLTHNNESDSESGYLRPNSPMNSISNPSYHFPPALNTQKELLKSPDNYISMPQYKNIVMNSNSAPVQIDISKDNQKAHYVNGDAAIWDAINV
ncbi:hypothetical protein GWI33_020129 [Rhynchophorus ferrugineus]|uniref:receptor protein-tyrosine kinase n=1 Tax=Rhynchophorus ferrugineus TaxID=354439 RepID=A0A834HV13_RHYFE|nr:hypothetical protein GWI33_020129 [Rhynchophorus ferrugineus]